MVGVVGSNPIAPTSYLIRTDEAKSQLMTPLGSTVIAMD